VTEPCSCRLACQTAHPAVSQAKELLLRVVTDELLKEGIEITRARVELHGRISAW